MRWAILLICAFACGSCLADEAGGRAGKPVPTKPNPTFSNPASNVAPMIAPNAYIGGNGRIVVNRSGGRIPQR